VSRNPVHRPLRNRLSFRTAKSTDLLWKLMGIDQPFAHEEVEPGGFSIVHRVFENTEVAHLIDSISTISDKNGVRSRNGVYAIRNLLILSPVIRELAWSLNVR